jgi:uncharacterized protein
MVLSVKVKPGSRRQLIEPLPQGGGLLVHLQSPPVEGKANEELIAVLARHYGIRQAQIRIKAGASSRTKLVELPDGSVPRERQPT